MKNKKTKRILTALAVLVVMLMVTTTAVNAVSVKLIDKDTGNNLMQTLSKDKEDEKYGWTEKEISKSDLLDDGRYETEYTVYANVNLVWSQV